MLQWQITKLHPSPVDLKKKCQKEVFLAVHDSSIGDLVSHLVKFWFQHYNDYKFYNDYNDYNYYNDYSDYNDYRDSYLDLDLD